MRVKENKPQKINSKQNLCGKYEHGDTRQEHMQKYFYGTTKTQSKSTIKFELIANNN